jgi:hypothetical protein
MFVSANFFRKICVISKHMLASQLPDMLDFVPSTSIYLGTQELCTFRKTGTSSKDQGVGRGINVQLCMSTKNYTRTAQSTGSIPSQQ